MKPLGRVSYLLCGVVLVAIKIGLDRLVLQSYGDPVPPAIYWPPIHIALMAMFGHQLNGLMALSVIAILFSVCSVWLTMRRLKALQLRGWLSFLIFLPGVNLLFFCFLVATPEASPKGEPQNRRFRLLAMLKNDSIASLFVCAGIAAICGLLAAVLSVLKFQSYSFGVFLALPFAIGLLTTLLVFIQAPRSFEYCFQASVLSLSLCGSLMLVAAFEGVFCLVMALPIALLLAALGVFVGREIAKPGPSQLPTKAALVATLMVSICPLTAIGDAQPGTQPETVAVVTQVVIDAPAAEVWKHVIAFPDLPTSREWIFHAGIAYPIRARIEGQGEGAVRYCEFSTGPFVEPITKWHQPHLLAFDVTSSPAPMQELSPLRHSSTSSGWLPAIQARTISAGASRWRQKNKPRRNHLVPAVALSSQLLAAVDQLDHSQDSPTRAEPHQSPRRELSSGRAKLKDSPIPWP